MKKRKKNLIIQTLKNLLWPEVCPFCGNVHRGGACPACQNKLEELFIREPRCMQCGKPVRNMEQEYCYDCAHTRHYYDQGERCGFTEIRSNSLFINSNTTIRENMEHIMREKWRGAVEILSVRLIRRYCFRCRCIAENVGREDIIRRKFWHSN